MKNGTYTIDCRCSNCGKAATVTLLRGTRFAEKKAEGAPEACCPNCGCPTLSNASSEWGNPKEQR